jgi:hypothetical protein
MMTHLTAVETFRQLVNAHNVAPVQGLFVQDIAGPPPYPNVGLTTGVGPQFKFQNGIGILFTALFASFPNLVFSYVNTLRPVDGDTIAVEALLTTGAHEVQWAPQGAPVSPPLSLIEPKGHGSTDLPVCAVFLFDHGSDLIKNLGLYFDRWKLAMDLWDRAHPSHLA